MRTTSTRAAVVLAAAAAVVTGGVLPASAAPGCSTAWGSLPETVSDDGGGTLDGVRAGRHTCYDRLVLDLDGIDASAVSYDVRYVGQVARDGSGAPVPLRGAADLQVVVHTPAYDDRGAATYDPADDAEAVDVAGYSTFRQVAWAGSFEGSSTVGLGVRARLPFRVVVLDGPGDGSRLVVDVAHTW
ncbi:AMIN-like domain-containing (lipo)protein [Geodermatophilus sp. SYSU D00766]